MIANFEVTTEEASTEEQELWTTASLEAMTDEMGTVLEVTTGDLRAYQYELLMWTRRS